MKQETFYSLRAERNLRIVRSRRLQFGNIQMAFPPQRYNQAYNDYAFMDLCITGQVNTLACLMETEERYCFTRVDCIRYRRHLDTAAGAVNRGRVDTPTTSRALLSTNPDWRYKVARWLLRAADDLSISRQTAIIALSYCDRFLIIGSTKDISSHRYQVTAIACLFVASKIFESGKAQISVAKMMSSTQNKFMPTEVLCIERAIVASLGSYLHPPTASTFCLILLSGFINLPVSAVETCLFVIELAACDFFFVSHKQSRLAVASIIVMLEQAGFSIDLIRRMWQTTKLKSSIILLQDSVTMSCVEQLRKIYTHNLDRIIAIDSKSHRNITVTTTDNSTELNRGCREATPSPTINDSGESSSEVPNQQCQMSTDTEKRKRHWCEIT